MAGERPSPELIQEQTRRILKERTPLREEVIFEPTVEFLDPDNQLTREERGRVIAMGDRTAIAYKELVNRVVEERGKTTILGGEVMESTTAFYLQYALAARSQNEISHTSILEQMNAGPEEFGGDPPIIIEGVSILAGLRDVCALRHFGFEAFSSRGGIFPEGYWRIPKELVEAGVGDELEDINREVYKIYLELTERGIKNSLQTLQRREGERDWQFRWRVLNIALDDARQVTNQSFLNHFSMHPNSALALREALVKLSSSELPETVEIADRIRKLATKGLSTLMRFTEASPYQQSLPQKRREALQRLRVRESNEDLGNVQKTTLLKNVAGSWEIRIDPDENAEIEFLAAFLANGNRSTKRDIRSILALKTPEEVDELIGFVFDNMGFHDKPPQELEVVQIHGDFLFSIGAIYELIRHRPQTNLLGRFSTHYSYTMPDVYNELGLAQVYADAMNLNDRGYKLIAGLGSRWENVFGPYFVSRAHLQPVSVRMSALDAFHTLKLRADQGAHPDIRGPMFELEQALREACPAIFRHLVKKQ